MSRWKGSQKGGKKKREKNPYKYDGTKWKKCPFFFFFFFFFRFQPYPLAQTIQQTFPPSGWK